MGAVRAARAWPAPVSSDVTASGPLVRAIGVPQTLDAVACQAHPAGAGRSANSILVEASASTTAAVYGAVVPVVAVPAHTTTHATGGRCRTCHTAAFTRAGRAGVHTAPAGAGVYGVAVGVVAHPRWARLARAARAYIAHGAGVAVVTSVRVVRIRAARVHAEIIRAWVGVITIRVIPTAEAGLQILVTGRGYRARVIGAGLTHAVCTDVETVAEEAVIAGVGVRRVLAATGRAQIVRARVVVVAVERIADAAGVGQRRIEARVEPRVEAGTGVSAGSTVTRWRFARPRLGLRRLIAARSAYAGLTTGAGDTGTVGAQHQAQHARLTSNQADARGLTRDLQTVAQADSRDPYGAEGAACRPKAEGERQRSARPEGLLLRDALPRRAAYVHAHHVDVVWNGHVRVDDDHELRQVRAAPGEGRDQQAEIRQDQQSIHRNLRPPEPMFP